MNYSDISLLVVAAILILYRAWTGWRYGASYEIRYLLMLTFGVLVAIRFWQPCTEKLVDAVNFDPRWITIGAFAVLFTVGAVVAGVIVNIKAQVFQSVQRNYLDNFLGLAAGLFSGALLGACVIWLSTIAVPGKFDSVSYAQSFLDFPREVFRAIETAVGVAPGSAGRTRYPEATIVEVPVDASDTNVVVPEGSVLMRQRGQVAWK
jgi:uncharacterized membrane protein required for colicin V production